MGDTLIIDSDILIDFFRENQEVVRWFNENKEKFTFTTTIINVFELYIGAYKSFNSVKKIKELEDFLNTIKIFEFTIECAKESGRQRAFLEKQGQSLETRDLLIGSIALTENIPLKTNNKKHFERIEGLKFVE